MAFCIVLIVKAFRLPGHRSRSASFPGTFLHGKPVPNPGAWQVSLGPSFVHKEIHELGTKKHGLLCKKLPPLHQKWNDCILPSCHPDDMQNFMDPCLPGRVHLGMMFMTKGKSPRMLWWDECGFWCFAACSKWRSESWSLLQALGLTQHILIAGWWFQTFVYFSTPTWGDDPIWRAYVFWNGWGKTTN